jgi:WD40 repeat protein
MTVTTSPPIDAAADAAGRINPFPGLRPFREDEESLFFGRESQVDSMVDKLAATRFLSVVGTSGSGKSSLVNCGLRPALHRGLMTQVGTTWRMAQFRPGADPVRAMAGALSQDGVLFRDYKATGLTLAEIVDTTLRMSKVGLIDIFEQARLGDDVNLLVVVDQFEELFRYRQLQDSEQDSGTGVAEAAVAFVNLLLEAKEQSEHPIYVVLTMRSDFLGECAQIPGLAEAVNDGQYLVPRMTRDERRAAIAGPIAVGGAEIEPVLLTRLLNDVGDNPDQLSILQHALNRTWAHWQHERRAEGPIDLEDYKAIGTMSCALDRHAEKAFGELGSDEKKKLCERIFKALTDKATDPRGIRRPSAFQKLCELTGAEAAAVAAVLEVFRKPSRSFVMPPAEEPLLPETVVDISHESLMRIWQRLNRWADEEAQSARIYRRLAEAAERNAKNEAGLLRDPELQLALNWRRQNEPNESWASQYQPGFAPAMTYLADSEAARNKERRAARRRTMSLVAIAVILFALLVVSALLGVWAFRQKKQAQNASNAATQLALTATANDSSVTPLGSALLLSLAAYQRHPSFDSRRSVVLALSAAAEQPLRLIFRTHTPANALAVSPDGHTVATADQFGHVRRWDLDTYKQVGPTLHGFVPSSHRSTVHPSVAFGRDGTLAEGTNARLTLWISGKGRGVSLRDTGKKTHIKGDVRTVAFSRDGKLLASSGFDGVVRLWDVKTHKLLHPFSTGKKAINSVAFSPGGRLLAAAGEGGGIHVWDVKSHRPFARLILDPFFSPAVNSIAFSADGEAIASAAEDGSIRAWDMYTRKPTTAKAFITGRPFVDLAVSPNNTRAAAVSDDGTVRIWDVTEGSTGKLLFSATSPGSSTNRTVDFLKDGRLVSLSADGNITTWAENPSSFGVPLQGRVSSSAGPVAVPVQLAGLFDVSPVLAVSPDGKTLVAGDQGLRIWNAKTRRELANRSPAAKSQATAVAFSRDGRLLAEGTGNGQVRLWRASDLPNLVPVGRASLSGGSGMKYGIRPAAESLAFNRDGLLAFGDTSGHVHVWNARPGTRPQLVGIGSDVRNPEDERSVFDVAFSPNGKTLASGGWDGTLRLWNVSDPSRPRQITAPDAMKAPGAIRTIAFGPHGRVIAVGSSDGTIALWDTVTRKQLRAATPDSDAVESVAFTAGGQVLITVGDDGVVRFWDVDTLHPLGQLVKSHIGRIRRLVLSPDGSTFATASGRDGSVRLWSGIAWPTGKALTDRICHLVAGGIAPTEWKAIIPAGVKQSLPNLCGGVKPTS